MIWSEVEWSGERGRTDSTDRIAFAVCVLFTVCEIGSAHHNHKSAHTQRENKTTNQATVRVITQHNTTQHKDVPKAERRTKWMDQTVVGVGVAVAVHMPSLPPD